VKVKPAPKNMTMPDNFYSTTNNNSQIFRNGKWDLPKGKVEEGEKAGTEAVGTSLVAHRG
jgi:hypothetical protein